MVKKTSALKLLGLAMLLVASMGVSQSALAQDTIMVSATPFHRFITQNATLGHFLTSNFSEGSGYPYNYAYQPFPYGGDIIPVVPGYQPRAGQGLVPVHRWQVDQRPRIYYYYSIYYAAHGSDYRYQGIAGYALAANDPRGTPFHYWYSQNYGYYFTTGPEYPPYYSFSYHGTSWNLPVGGTYIFDKIPEPCAGFEAQREQCELNGNIWNESTCSCRVFICRFCEEPVL
ncbi:MAG TPA: hypothetical protein VF618_21435 [Thermoanaerobaculia bacterium]